MRLFIKQRVFSIGDKYNILNEAGETVFYATSKIFSFGAKISLFDSYDSELFFIKQKVMSFLPQYHIYQGDNLCAVIKKEFSFLKPKLTVESNYGTYQLDGNLFALDFNVICDGRLIGSISKKLFTWGDSYVLDIQNDSDAAFFCSIVIAIDNCLHNSNNN